MISLESVGLSCYPNSVVVITFALHAKDYAFCTIDRAYLVAENCEKVYLYSLIGDGILENCFHRNKSVGEINVDDLLIILIHVQLKDMLIFQLKIVHWFSCSGSVTITKGEHLIQQA
ncbi:hypothetical protein H8356DRAFT_1356042 [Neocallimastix lanati (nom. inval.)]|nr:hypothetical protein H8356DRAFT_1356042 [Neocallimastix sp. JGI-2020a]